MKPRLAETRRKQKQEAKISADKYSLTESLIQPTMATMQFKPQDFLALATFILSGLIAIKKPKKFIVWFLIIISGGYLLFAIVSPSEKNKSADNYKQTVITSGNNSSAANFSVIALGSNSTTIQAAPGAIVNAAINPISATNPSVEGNFNTVYGNVSQSIHGNGNTIVGATDNRGNTIITQSMAVGFGSHVGPNSISIGAFSGSGQSTINTNSPTNSPQ